jgi:hypothetical protein
LRKTRAIALKNTSKIENALPPKGDKLSSEKTVYSQSQARKLEKFKIPLIITNNPQIPLKYSAPITASPHTITSQSSGSVSDSGGENKGFKKKSLILGR